MVLKLAYLTAPGFPPLLRAVPKETFLLQDTHRVIHVCFWVISWFHRNILWSRRVLEFHTGSLLSSRPEAGPPLASFSPIAIFFVKDTNKVSPRFA